MPNFRYRAKDGVEYVEGIIDAQDRQGAVDKINQMGYIPVHVEVVTNTAELEKKTHGMLFSRIRSKDITIFSRQLASLIKSGVPILRALTIISQQTKNPNLKKIFISIRNQVKGGAALSVSFANYPKIFPPVFISMVQSGETTGTLEEVLFKIAEYRKKQEEIISRIRTALAYPILMSIVGVCTVYFMLTFVMPRLMRVFTHLGQDLPLPTRILIAISAGLKQWWYLILAGLIIIFFVFKKLAKSKNLILSRMKLRLPIMGGLMHKGELARFNRTLELLVKCGVPLLKGLEVATPVTKNEVMKKELMRSYNELRSGSSLGKSLEHSNLFPEFMTNLIIVGEESGKLDDVLGEIADSYEKDLDDALKVMSSMFEPLIILVMGLIVGFLVIAMLLPIFQMNLMMR